MACSPELCQVPVSFPLSNFAKCPTSAWSRYHCPPEQAILTATGSADGIWAHFFGGRNPTAYKIRNLHAHAAWQSECTTRLERRNYAA